MTTGARIFWAIVASVGGLILLAGAACVVMSIWAVVLGHGQ